MPNSVNISLPGLNGSGICDLSTRLGFPMSYEGNQYTRREYFEKMLDHFIQANRCSELLTFLFGKPQFQSHLSRFSPEKIDKHYDTIVKTVLEKNKQHSSFQRARDENPRSKVCRPAVRYKARSSRSNDRKNDRPTLYRGHHCQSSPRH